MGLKIDQIMWPYKHSGTVDINCREELPYWQLEKWKTGV
jgi:hypothetical protein